MSVTDELIVANADYVAAFDKGDLPMPPGRQVAIVVCMDARIDPAKALGLDEGDAHVIRNAGGRAEDAIRSLVISQQLLGTKVVAVIHHTDCGMLTFTNDVLRGKVGESLGTKAADVAGSIDFLPFQDVEQSVREDLATIRNSPLIPDTYPVRGFVYDVTDGSVSEVV